MGAMTINQASAIFNEVIAQATGRKDLAVVDASNFVSVAETAKREVGVEPIYDALTMVLSKTTFDINPYYRKFDGIRVDLETYGNWEREVFICDQDAIDNQSYLIDSADPAPLTQWTHRKDKILQMNYYGQDTYSDYMSFEIMQLNTALSSLSEWAKFVGMKMQNLKDRIEQRREAGARLAVCNFIAAKYVADTDNVYSLLSEYYLDTGKYLVTDKDDSRYYALPANYPDFCKWAAAFIQTLSDRFEERTVCNHMNPTINTVAFPIPQHTQKSRQHLYLYAPEINKVQTRVLSDVFNQEYIKKVGDFEKVSYWQSYQTPDSVYIKPAYIDEHGVQVENPDAVSVENVFGLLFDTDAIQIADVYESMRNTPIESAQEFYNVWFHLNQRYKNNLVRNAALFLINQHLPDPSYMHIAPDALTIAPGASGVVNVTYPQSSVTATVDATALADGVTASYSDGKVTIAVAGTTSVESATVTITDGTTTEAVTVTIVAAEAKSRKK